MSTVVEPGQPVYLARPECLECGVITQLMDTAYQKKVTSMIPMCQRVPSNEFNGNVKDESQPRTNTRGDKECGGWDQKRCPFCGWKWVKRGCCTDPLRYY
jgi:hypothetical protein